MIKYLLSLCIACLAGSCFTGCRDSPARQFQDWQASELASGVRYDSLPGDLYFGMSFEEFRIHCMALHLAGKTSEGGLKSGSWLLAALPDGLAHPAYINYFPTFEGNVITKLEAAIYYADTVAFSEARPFHQDSLLQDVLGLMDEQYGPGFLRIESPVPGRGEVYAKVTGNRRLTVWKDLDPYLVNLWFVNLAPQTAGHEL
ncbi:hypothetical protein CLV84_0690 [Neolewinella xylanilytica]|uniref:Lipoprotein n=1 Tax=Neolewinella xylanilytica TaxID=1514080 RepID=A0A2S6I8C1_9BACT|nr:hypothetical protein [Neolewinella xylanilytica]PPK87740.1 hypothetical protein CLV84_0690 [Neolewinella xylanilytica]